MFVNCNCDLKNLSPSLQDFRLFSKNLTVVQKFNQNSFFKVILES